MEFDSVNHGIVDKDVFPGGADKPEVVDVKEFPNLYDVFAQYVDYYMNLLRMYDWRYEIACVPLGCCRYSQVRFNIPQRLAVFVLNRELPTQHTTLSHMRETALHEVLHLMLDEHEWACSAFSDEDTRGVLADNAQHSIINRLVPLLLGVRDKNEEKDADKEM
ncbi:MAG: hypothetical protein HDQ88_12040 [Clostridia bacterium]|nr:hypothetical protein [Clostridia bacterium]